MSNTSFPHRSNNRFNNGGFPPPISTFQGNELVVCICFRKDMPELSNCLFWMPLPGTHPDELTTLLAHHRHNINLKNLIPKSSQYYKEPSMKALSRRQLEVLNCILQEKETKEIAEELHVSVSTINHHRSKLRDITGTQSLVGLTLWAIRQGFFDGPQP